MTTDYAKAHADLDQWGSVIAQGANTAPDMTMRTIIAMRGVLNRHHPETYGVGEVCSYCRDSSEEPLDWPCPDAEDVLSVLGLPEDEDPTEA